MLLVKRFPEVVGLPQPFRAPILLIQSHTEIVGCTSERNLFRRLEYFYQRNHLVLSGGLAVAARCRCQLGPNIANRSGSWQLTDAIVKWRTPGEQQFKDLQGTYRSDCMADISVTQRRRLKAPTRVSGADTLLLPSSEIMYECTLTWFRMLKVAHRYELYCVGWDVKLYSFTRSDNIVCTYVFNLLEKQIIIIQTICKYSELDRLGSRRALTAA